jgi:hypothetical protein
VTVRDYVEWHKKYDDPSSPSSLRLRMIQAMLTKVLAANAGPLRLLSLAAGDARDILDVLEQRPADVPRIAGRMIEILPELVATAQSRIAAIGSPLEMVEDDAGDPQNLIGHIPADVVLLIGIMGNVSDDDDDYLADVVASFCAPGALMIWSRGHDNVEMVRRIRGRLADAGFVDQRFWPVPNGTYGLGTARWPDKPTPPLPMDRKLFTFIR